MAFDNEAGREKDSQIPDVRVNEFSYGQPAGNSSDFNPMTEQSSPWGAQGQFPQFGEGALSGSGIEDIQAKIEAAKSNGWGAQIAGFIGHNKKRLFVLAAIVALFAASSYLSDKSNQNVPGEDDKSAGIAGISQNLPEALKNTDKNDGENSQEPNNQSLSPSLDIKLGEDGQIVLNGKNEKEERTQVLAHEDSEVSAGEIVSTEDSVTVTAKAGDGITHLARHAIKEYLAQKGKTLSAEQKIYAEDYAQNKTGSEMMEVGQKLSFANDLLSEAVEKAQALENWQIENLKQYTANVSL